MSKKSWKLETDLEVHVDLTVDKEIGPWIRTYVNSYNPTNTNRIHTDLAPDDAIAFAEMLIAAAKEAKKIKE